MHVISAWFDTQPMLAPAVDAPAIHFHADCVEEHTEAVIGFEDEASRDAALRDPALVQVLMGLALDHVQRCRLGDGALAMALSRQAALEARAEASRTWSATKAVMN
ncbi:MAG TPA: hypothetical protein VNI83_05340 [Vicinamibacterales bacterium]|nr:hypothetical protein [Vicinamibacterales bacterium]